MKNTGIFIYTELTTSYDIKQWFSYEVLRQGESIGEFMEILNAVSFFID